MPWATRVHVELGAHTKLQFRAFVQYRRAVYLIVRLRRGTLTVAAVGVHTRQQKVLRRRDVWHRAVVKNLLWPLLLSETAGRVLARLLRV